jgi:hypothetical protein
VREREEVGERESGGGERGRRTEVRREEDGAEEFRDREGVRRSEVLFDGGGKRRLEMKERLTEVGKEQKKDPRE